MIGLLSQQQRLLEEKLRILARIKDGLTWSLDRLPVALDTANIDHPVITERMAAIVERFRKLQDQLASAMRHAHEMLGERQRNFQDVVRWAISESILADEATWLELRSPRNRLTHEYDLAGGAVPELMTLVRQSQRTLAAATDRFIQCCAEHSLVNIAT